MLTGTVRSVCRSLFSRSMSVSCEVGTKRKREREEEEEGEEREGTENQLAKRRKSECFNIVYHQLISPSFTSLKKLRHEW